VRYDFCDPGYLEASEENQREIAKNPGLCAMAQRCCVGMMNYCHASYSEVTG